MGFCKCFSRSPVLEDRKPPTITLVRGRLEGTTPNTEPVQRQVPERVTPITKPVQRQVPERVTPITKPVARSDRRAIAAAGGPCHQGGTVVRAEQAEEVKPNQYIKNSLYSRTSSAVIEAVATVAPMIDKSRPRTPIEWVVGLDFGTTYSGFAYAKATGSREILVPYDWPCRTAEKPYCKTLTGLFYKKDAYGKLQCESWGYLARSDFLPPNKSQIVEPHGRHYLSKFKLLLKKDLNDTELAASIPYPLTVNTVIEDYLRYIGEHALASIKNHDGEARFKRDAVQWCVTVPSIWDENAKQQMKACMVNAGLVSAAAGGIEAVKVVLEPEAASFHCHQILRQTHRDMTLFAKDKILVADVGGGTVDIVVQELIGSGQDYRVQELTESSGGLCGGTFVDEAFMRFLSNKIGCLDEFLRSDFPSYRTRLLKDWEDIKFAFGHDKMSSTDTKDITLHPKLASKWEGLARQRGQTLRDSSIVELTERDLKSIFDPVVDKILALIAAQLSQVSNIKVMFVVGGFAGSPYLMERIRKHFSKQVSHIVCPPNPGSAITQGAVSLALNPDAIVARILKKTYGTSVTLPFRRGVDPPHLKKIMDGAEYCRNRFDIFVTKGQRIEVNKCVTKDYVPHGHGQTQMMFDLYSSTETDPNYVEGATVAKEGYFTVTLPRNYSKAELPKYDFSMYFGRSNIELRVEAKFEGQEAKAIELPVRYYS